MAGVVASCSSVLRPLRQVVTGVAIASSSRSSNPTMRSRAFQNTSGRSIHSTKSTSSTAHRLFSSSSTNHEPPPPQEEVAVSRPLDTPPSPIPVPGKQKSIPPHLHHQNSIQSEKNEACQTLSPSSPAAPRSQGGSGANMGKGKESSEGSSAEASQQSNSPKAIPPEVVNQPSTGRKTSGKVFKAQKAALTLSPTAIERLRGLLESSGGPKLIRIGVRNKGCAGMSYHLEYVSPDQAGKFDERVKQDGVEVLIESKALFSIIGSEMDWEEDLLSAKFVFHNPNVVDSCGCGESVRFG